MNYWTKKGLSQWGKNPILHFYYKQIAPGGAIYSVNACIIKDVFKL